MFALLKVSSYGEHFIIECATQQDFYSVKNILDKDWISFKQIDSMDMGNLPSITAKNWLKD